jgi:hypothetical protein
LFCSVASVEGSDSAFGVPLRVTARGVFLANAFLYFRITTSWGVIFCITDSRAGAAIIGAIETVFVFCAHPIATAGRTCSAVGGAAGTTFKVVCVFSF